MAWLVEDFLHIAHFDDFPSVHHIHIIRHLRDDAKVMRDVNDGQVHFLLNLFDEVENFALDCHVQCGGGFVADKNVRFGGERNGDNDALPHTAGKLVRIVAEALFGIGDAHQFQQLQGFRARLVLRHVLVQQHALHNLLADGHRGVKARHGVLEYHREALTVVFRAQLLFAQFQQINGFVLSVPVIVCIQDFAAVDGGVAVQQADGGFHRYGFSRTGFAHDGDGFALLQIQIDAADGMYHAGVRAEGNIQILDLQNGLC